MKLAEILSVGSVLLLCAGCGGSDATHDSLTQEMIACMNEQADLHTTITDEASAQEALPRLEELVKKNTELKLRADELGMPGPGGYDALREKYEAALVKAGDRIEKEMERIRALKDSTKVLDVLTKPVFSKLRPK